MRELLTANLAKVLLLARVSGLMIDQVRLRFETGVAGLTNVRPIVRVHQLMPLEQLSVFETLVALVAHETSSVVVFRFLVIHDGAGMIQNFVAHVAGIDRFSFLWHITQ